MRRTTVPGHALAAALLAVVVGACISTPSLGTLAPDGGAAGLDGGVADSAPVEGVDGGVNPPGEVDGATVEDASAPETSAPEDGSVTCPAACTGGCGGGICVIRGVGGSTCPPGQACQVNCETKDTCEGTIRCAAGQPCVVTCTANKACNSLQIDQNGASSLCLRCSGGSQACNSVTCSAASCTKVCIPGDACNSTCENCTNVAACP